MAHVFKQIAGVYKMTNIVTGNLYVGSTTNLSKRIGRHRYVIKNGIGDNARIKEDALKHGINSFKFEVLELCDSEILKEREQYYFELLKPTYNIWPSIYSAAGRSYTSEQLKRCFPKREIKDKMAFSEKLRKAWEIRRNKPETLALFAKINRTGKKHSDETIKLFCSQRKGKKKTESMKEKLREARLGSKWDPINKTWIKKEDFDVCI